MWRRGDLHASVATERDRYLTGLPQSQAAHLVERGPFEHADPSDVPSPRAGDADESTSVTDPDAFVNRGWRAVVSDIESGAVDNHLHEIRDAEGERPNGPRDSVVTALGDRLDTEE